MKKMENLLNYFSDTQNSRGLSLSDLYPLSYASYQGNGVELGYSRSHGIK
jgi:hypothetical protein